MTESGTAVQPDQTGPKHVLRRGLLGRPRAGMEPVKVIVERHRSTS